MNYCLADPEVDRRPSAFQKAGFHVVKEFFDPRDGKRHALLCLDPRWREPVGRALPLLPMRWLGALQSRTQR